MSRIDHVVMLLSLSALSVAGCKKAEPAPPPEVSTPAPAPAPAPLAVVSIDLGKSIGPDKKTTAMLNNFNTRDTIYAVVTTSGAGSNASIAAKWTYLGSKETTVNESSQSISPTGPDVTEFHIVKATPWPAGNYKVEIMLNGASAGTKEFAIAKAK